MPVPRFFRTAIFRLSAINCAVFIVFLLVTMIASYWTATAVLRDQMRSAIQDEIDELAAESNGGNETDIAERLALMPKPADYYYLVGCDGRKLAGNLETVTISEGWREMPIDPKALAAGADEPDDHRLWGIGKRLPGGAFLFVGQDAHRVISAQNAIIEAFAWSAGLALLLATLAGMAVSRSFLRRIDAIDQTSRAIMEGNLKERVPVRGTSDEIDRLSARLNRLFDSNQALLESLKQVGTDIAHDLRTPLTRLRQGLEEARASAKSKAAYAAAVDAAIAESDRLLATFSALLRIAQVESGSRKASFKDVSLSEIFERLANAYQPVIEDQGRRFVCAIAPDVHFHGDGELLTQMIANLLENAISHTPPGSAISLILAGRAATAEGIVADAGPGIPEAFRQRVMERFFRLDQSRNTAGNGLGLALVAAVAGLHGIAVTLGDNRPGLQVRLVFPAPKTKA